MVSHLTANISEEEKGKWDKMESEVQFDNIELDRFSESTIFSVALVLTHIEYNQPGAFKALEDKLADPDTEIEESLAQQILSCGNTTIRKTDKGYETELIVRVLFREAEEGKFSQFLEEWMAGWSSRNRW